MTETWINAVVEIIIPLDVSPTASNAKKQEAAGNAVDLIEFPEDAVVGAHWELVYDGEAVRPGERWRFTPERGGPVDHIVKAVRGQSVAFFQGPPSSVGHLLTEPRWEKVR